MFGIDLRGIFETILVILIAVGFAYSIWSAVSGTIKLVGCNEPKCRKEAISKLVFSGIGLVILIVLSFTLDTIVGFIF